MFDQGMNSPVVEIVFYRSSSSYFAAAATTHHFLVVLLPGQCDKTAIYLRRLPR
jgi:hypothetical protein